jgi:hypothetical protein
VPRRWREADDGDRAAQVRRRWRVLRASPASAVARSFRLSRLVRACERATLSPEERWKDRSAAKSASHRTGSLRATRHKGPGRAAPPADGGRRNR